MSKPKHEPAPVTIYASRDLPNLLPLWIFEHPLVHIAFNAEGVRPAYWFIDDASCKNGTSARTWMNLCRTCRGQFESSYLPAHFCIMCGHPMGDDAAEPLE